MTTKSDDRDRFVTSSLGTSVRVEVREIRPQARNFGLILHPRERHLVAGNFRTWVLHKRGEACLLPGEPRVLQGGRILISRCGSGLAAVQPIEFRPERVLRTHANGVAGLAFGKSGFAWRAVLRNCGASTGKNRDGEDDERNYCFHVQSPIA